jgi:hypothetical protein
MNSIGVGRSDGNRVARFFLAQHTKKGKIYQKPIKYSKWPQNIPNGHKISQHLLLQDPPKFSKKWIFGLKICHLATLDGNGQKVWCCTG